MSAVTIVEGALEALELIENLTTAAATVSSAVRTAQANGTAVDMTEILSEENAAENQVLAALAAAQARGQ